jgi:hypothetical protein
LEQEEQVLLLQALKRLDQTQFFQLLHQQVVVKVHQVQRLDQEMPRVVQVVAVHEILQIQVQREIRLQLLRLKVLLVEIMSLQVVVAEVVEVQLL